MSITQLPSEEQLGRYRLVARLARGGMAELFLGRLIGAGGFEKLVAIKRMLPHLTEDPEFVAMFQNEGRIAAALHHPNLCEVYELGEANGQLYLAMELLRGLPWSEIVAAIPDQPQAPFLRFVAGMLVQACEGLHHAHTATDELGKPRPVVHRDVSPSNLMITTEGTVKLLDFGVSKVLTERSRTRTGMLKGKLAYMAPEQVRNQPLDERTDIFSLGVIAWEAIAGRALFDRASDFEIFSAIVEGDIPPLPGGPVIAELDVAIRRALSRDREQRHASARAFADEIRRAIAPLGEPMSPRELEAQLATWLGPSLQRKSRDLADLVTKLRGDPGDEATAATAPLSPSMERTGIHVATPEEPGVRVRDRSLVVTADPLDSATTVEVPAPPAAATTTTVEMPGTTLEVTAPREVIVESAPRPIVVAAPIPPRPLPIEETPHEQRSWLPAIVIAIFAIATGVLVALWP